MGERNGDERRKRSRRVVRAREKGDKVGHLHRQALVAGETTCETLRLQIRRSPPSQLSGALAPRRVPVGEPQPAASPSPQSRSCASLPHSGSRAAPRRPSGGGARARGSIGGAQDNGKMRSLLYCPPWPSQRPVRSARSHAARSLTLERPGSDPVGEGGAVEAG